MILKSSRKNLKYQHGYGRNIVHLTVEYHPKSLYLTLGTLIAAVLFGVIMSAVLPGKWNTMLDLNLLTPVKTLYNHREIVDQIRTGNILVNKMSTELLDRQRAQFRPDPKRADELEAIFAEGFEKPVIKKIWPEFRRIAATGTFPFRTYTNDLKRYADDDIIFDNGYYLAAEAVVGRSMGPEADEYILLNNYDFFEFLPVGQTPSKETLIQAKDLKPGSDYEVFVTNTAGLYRYRLGDIIHVVRMKESIPVFTYLRRYDEVCSAGRARLTLNDFETIIPELEQEAGIDIHDYCVESDKELNSFRLMIELSPVEALRQGFTDLDMTELSETAERLFCSRFDSYAEARNSGEIAPVTVSLLESGTQLLYRDKRAVSLKCSREELKPVRILDTVEKIKFFHAFILK